MNLSNFDTSKVEDMQKMFSGCGNLEELDLSHFNTSNVTDTHRMFNECKNLEKLDLSNFDTSKVERMSRMFSECEKLKELDLSNFDTSNVMYELDDPFPDFDDPVPTTKNLDILKMFYNTYNLTRKGLKTLDKCILSQFKEEKNGKNEKSQTYANVNPKNLKLKDSKTKEGKENEHSLLDKIDNDDIPF